MDNFMGVIGWFLAYIAVAVAAFLIGLHTGIDLAERYHDGGSGSDD